MNVFEVLKKDHQEARSLFQQIEGLGASKSRHELFQKLKDELLRHTKAEEAAFYPQIKDQQQTHDLVEEAYHEHDQVEQMLSRIDGMPPDSDEWMQAVRKLRESVEHHVQEEENELFPKAAKLLGGRADQMGEQVMKAKH